MLNILGRKKQANISGSSHGVDYSQIDTASYAGHYSEERLRQKLTRHFKKIGIQAAYKALQLYYVTKNPKCPARIKAGIYGALGYFIAPVDAIADFIPFIGYTDDLAIIGAAIAFAHFYINDEVRQKAKEKLAWVFGEKAVSQLK